MGDEKRIRGRVASDKTWVSIKNLETGFCWMQSADKKLACQACTLCDSTVRVYTMKWVESESFGWTTNKVMKCLSCMNQDTQLYCENNNKRIACHVLNTAYEDGDDEMI